MTVNQITRQFFTRGRHIREWKVEECLRQELQDHVRQVHGRWTVSKNEPDEDKSGVMEPGRLEKQVNGETVTSESPDAEWERNGSDEPKQESLAQKELARQIVAVLEAASKPIKAHDITELLNRKGFHVDEAPVTSCLHRALKGRVRRDGLARWSLRDEEGSAAIPEDPTARQIIRVLWKEGGVLPTELVADHLSGVGAAISINDVAASLFRLREVGCVQRDGRGRWYLTDVGLATELDLDTEEAAKGSELEHTAATAAIENEQRPPATDLLEERTVHMLVTAHQALGASEIAKRLSEGEEHISASEAVRILYKLRKEGRVLLDREYKWHPAKAAEKQSEEVEETPVKKQQAVTDEQASGGQPEADPPLPAFAPSGAAGRVSTDLERAKHLAFVLELAPRPLKASELVQVLDTMGLAAPVEDVERLLAGPLGLYVQREEKGWTLRQEAAAPVPKAHIEASGVPPGEDSAEEQALAEHALLAQMKADGMAYEFVEADLDSPAVFSADMRGASTMQIKLNARHPAYELLEAAHTVGAPEAADVGTLRRLLRNTQRGLRLLLVGWARYEDNLEGPRRRRAQEARSDWGRSIRRVLQRHGERAPGRI